LRQISEIQADVPQQAVLPGQRQVDREETNLQVQTGNREANAHEKRRNEDA
jgi:hypothetical protein